MTLWLTATQPQWLSPRGYVVTPESGRFIDLYAGEKHNRGRWRG